MHIVSTIIELEELSPEQRRGLLSRPEERPLADGGLGMFTDVCSVHSDLRARVVGWGRYDSHGGIVIVTLLIDGSHFMHLTQAELVRSWRRVEG